MKKERLNAVFKALSHPTRRAILLSLATTGPLSVGELAKPFKMSEPAVIKHLTVLEAASLLTVERDGQIRRRVLNAAPLREAFGFLGTFADHWERNFDQLEDLLESIKKNTGGKYVGSKKA